MIAFGERLKELRTEKRLTQSGLAKLFNVSNRTISAWENAANEPNQDMLIALSKFFEVTTDYLLGLED